ncbi:MAG: glutathione S-transferase N-terminal domain-containing protein [Gammaproteobacteria bacterium]|nr:glutathione S-transferase N-terminal domain-containing protein [Gammaproteobacteria bacterium]
MGPSSAIASEGLKPGVPPVCSPIQYFKLFHYPASRSARAKWMLHEVVDDAFETERVALYDGAQYSDEYLQRNPNHAVPLLEVTWSDSTIQRVIESAAIVAFLADAWSATTLPSPTALQ